MDMTYSCETSNIGLLLHSLEHSERKDKIKLLQNIGFILASKDSMRMEFHKQGGNNIIMKYLQDFDWKIAGTAFHILEKSMCQNLEDKLLLTTKQMFQEMLQVLKYGTVNHKKSCMYFVASVVNGNVLGQTLVRESGCLDHLLYLCHETMLVTSSSKKDYWQFLCAAIKMCVNNPQNFTNQYQTSFIIPKAVTFLDNWLHQAFNKHFSEYVHILIGMLVSIIAGNPTNQLCFSVYSGIETIVRGLNLLNEWQDAPLTVTDVLEKLVILLDAAIHNNPANCEQVALQGVISLMLKMLPKFKEQQKFSLLMALTHLIGGSSNNKKEFIRENGITTVVVSTINLKEDSKIGNAANMIIKLCADTALQQDEQKENSNIIDFECSNMQNDGKKLISIEDNINVNKPRKQLEVSKVANKQAQTDNVITSCSCSSTNQSKTYSYCKTGQNLNKMFTLKECTSSSCTPRQHTNKTIQNSNANEEISIQTCILNSNIAGNSQTIRNERSSIVDNSIAEANVVDNSELNLSVQKRQNNIRYLCSESPYILQKKNENIMHTEPLCKTSNKSIKTKLSQNRNKNHSHVIQTHEYNPSILPQTIKNKLYYQNCAISHNTESENKNMQIGVSVLPFQENNFQSGKEVHVASRNTDTSCSTSDYYKNSQNNTVVRANVLQINDPALSRKHQITNEKLAMSHDMMLSKDENSTLQLLRNPDFQMDTSLKTNTHKFNSKPRDISCKVSNKIKTFHNTNGNPESDIYSEIIKHQNFLDAKQKSYVKITNQNSHPRIPQVSDNEQQFDKILSQKEKQKNNSNTKEGSCNKTANQNIYSKTSQSSYPKQYLENNNLEINKQKAASSTNERSHKKIANQNIHPRTSLFANSEHIQSTYSKTNMQNDTSSIREDSHENFNKSIHPIIFQYSDFEQQLENTHLKINKQFTSSSRRAEYHNKNVNQNVQLRTSQFSHPKQCLLRTHSEMNMQQNRSSFITREMYHNKYTDDNINPEISQFSHSQPYINTHSQTSENNNFVKKTSTDNNASVNHSMITNYTNDTSKLCLNSKDDQYEHHIKRKSKSKNGNNEFAAHGNTKMSKHQFIYSRNGATDNKTKSDYFSLSSSTHIGDSNNVSNFHSHFNEIQKRNETDLMQSFDSKQSFQHPVRSFTSFIAETSASVIKQLKSKSKIKPNKIENTSTFEQNKASNSSLHLEDTHTMNTKDINGTHICRRVHQFHKPNIVLSLIKNETTRSPSRNTSHCQKHDIEQTADKEDSVVVETKCTYTDTCSNLTDTSKSTSLRPSFPLEKRIFNKKHVSSPRHKSSRRPMLKFTKIELDNLTAGVAKYGLDFKVMLNNVVGKKQPTRKTSGRRAIRRAYTFHRMRTSKDLYLKWRNSFINPRRYHGPGPHIQNSDRSATTCLRKFE